jgi:hypothetical protein
MIAAIHELLVAQDYAPADRACNELSATDFAIIQPKL